MSTRAPLLSTDLDDPEAVPYFLWDDPMTVGELRRRLAEGSESERASLLGKVLREAKDTDVWKLTTPQAVMNVWPMVSRHLGRRRAFWEFLLAAWREQGLIDGEPPH
ncbi:MAG TPA: hypothetical protein VGS57_06865 [Thermoanaerobaculia bacterium]|jgi:hypothetical protein|nr:hypothetical protein [Thermoanaerobaculia bacterium]